MVFGYPPPYYPYGGVPVDASTRPADLSALSRVRLSALIGIVAGALGIVEIAATPAFTLFSVGATSGGTTISVNLTAFLLAVVFGSLGFAFVLIELWLYRRAFQTLTTVDSRFSTPGTLALTAAIGVVLVALGALGLVAVFYQAISCAAGGPITTACLNVAGLLGLGVLVLIAGIIAFIGYVGVLVGIWRLGTRYRDGRFKAGAVLLLLPFLSFVGAILIWIAARSSLASLGTAPPPLSF